MKKSFKKIVSFATSPFALGLVVTAGITYASLDYYANRNLISKNDHSLPALIQQLHEKTIDWRMIARGPQPGSDRVAVLAIDERSLEQEGHFPWPRDKVAHLVDRAVELGAKSVSFDIVFAEPDQNSSIPTLRKLRADMSSKQQLSGDLNNAIESEITSTDGDRIFADTIKKRADQLILGAYFDSSDPGAPHRDYCQDAVFERSYQGRYWKHQDVPTVIDSSLNAIGFPSGLKSTISEYLNYREINRAALWFDDQKGLRERIHASLTGWVADLPPESYSGLATLWINNDLTTTMSLLQQMKPEAVSEDSARTLLNQFGSTLTTRERVSLIQALREEGKEYCGKFLSSEDPIMSFENFKALHGANAEIEDQFKEFSLRSSFATLMTQGEKGREPSNQKSAKVPSFDDMIERVKSLSLFNQIQPIERWWVNIPILGDATKHTGFFNASQDTDGTIRHAMILARQGNSYMPSLALETFLNDKQYTAVTRIEPLDSGRRAPTTKVASTVEIYDSSGNIVMRVPTDSRGQMMINYSGGTKMFPHISAAEMFNDNDDMMIEIQKPTKDGRWRTDQEKVNKKEFLKDKLLIVGATAIGIYDLRVTPFEENYPGIETHANVLSNLLVEHDRAKGLSREPANALGFLRTHPQEPRLMWITLLAIGLVLSALLSYFGSVAGLGITAAAMAGVYAIDRYWIFGQGIVVTVLFPHFEVFGTFVTLTFYKYFTEERKKRELKGTFEKYVSPSIVAEVLSDPENIELGGKKMELTVMFSDVRGFTKISEKLDPRALSDLLNSYLTPMTGLVFKNKGTLDKYMGDAIMAFWGAPIHFPDHAKHAARCALQMIDKLKELQKEYRDRGLPEIDIGIGLNTGDMSVGNMGSDTVRSYTVMGDAVNLGSRLEGINKQYGTRIIVSEFTQAAIKDTFTTREVDWVRVKGKEQPVRIFELVCEGKPDADRGEVLKRFHAGFALYHERRFQEAVSVFQSVLKIDPNDAVTLLYLERCEDYLKDPPPENWDGVFTMTSK